VIGEAGKTPLYSQATWRWTGDQWALLHPATSPAVEDIQFGLLATDAASGTVILVNQHTGAVWTWDGMTWGVRMSRQSPPGRDGAGLVYDDKLHALLLLGGTASGSEAILTDMWGWDGATWNQINVSGQPPVYVRDSGGVAYDARLQVVVIYRIAPRQAPSAASTSQTWSWDGTAWQQIQ
jgi:hypothetical protein